MDTPNLLDFTLPELEDFVSRRGHPPFRGRQLWQWLWRRGQLDVAAMTNLAKALRAELSATASARLPRIAQVQQSQDGTVKFLLTLHDGAQVETVLIPDDDRFTQCLSCQVGCPMACTFCATGTMGLRRNMTGGEIAAQVLAARLWAEENVPQKPITNLVFMGMGEPFLNWPNVRRALHILTHPEGLSFSRRRVTLSTCGIPGTLQLLAEEDLALPAISLHAPTQELRARIMPKAAGWEITELMAALRRYPLRPRERITIEYLLLGGVNDTLAHARDLVRLLSHLKCKVNLIAYNPTPGATYQAPAPDAVLAFEDLLRRKGFTVTLRKSKGQDIAAACGQLATQGTAHAQT
ncbi:dual-specificity RNA methyltransferase RlmN [Thermodesulfomicrobium sp. WS]|uniref:23S rRNA (adenine(2503)-C(2))-methyltransferase RlmN n=1 Tax=Thermodesulfomicrobium sp. WS TaxID=3004129 RepID=UPI00249382D2|nr:23S rRNA (adenine(2503)-C(2))-methyltransferase RlmN [Thermodesulfomicrobium sp. WS]BDV00493.1 dual-specificity RNA methyltransferase RlmN [Thermodesulfomicrobium sp. WS]